MEKYALKGAKFVKVVLLFPPYGKFKIFCEIATKIWYPCREFHKYIRSARVPGRHTSVFLKFDQRPMVNFISGPKLHSGRHTWKVFFVYYKRGGLINLVLFRVYLNYLEQQILSNIDEKYHSKIKNCKWKNLP